MKKKASHLDRKTSTRWAQRLHVYLIEAIMADSRWTARDVAFHGGTSLHLSWQSPRFSEDLDFLLSDRRETEEVQRIMDRARARLQELVMRDDPDFRIELRNKTRDPGKMPVYHFVLTHPSYLGKVMVKTEFWRVTESYLENYPVVFRTPVAKGDVISTVSSAVPVARLETAFADKMTAFATRPHLKWRDIFDTWWIGTQTNADVDPDRIARQFLHNVSAYRTLDDLPPAEALIKFLERDPEEVVAKAESDLRKWLPDSLWRRLWPDTVREMVEYTRETLTRVSDACGGAAEPDSGGGPPTP